MGARAVTLASLDRDALRALVFDLDGTLYQDDRLGEQVHQSACRYVADLKGITSAEAGKLLREVRAGQCDTGGTLSRGVETLGGTLKEMHRRFNEDVRPEGVLSLDPRVTELLERLSRRFALYLYTNNNHALSGRIMAQLGIGSYFRKTFTIEDSWRPKPDREILEGILDAIGTAPAQTLFVGDRYDVDLKLPASLGCPVHEARTVEELLELGQLVD